jgi:hypothetical protein
LEDPQAARLGSAVLVALEDLEVLPARLEVLLVLVVQLEALLNSVVPAVLVVPLASAALEVLLEDLEASMEPLELEDLDLLVVPPASGAL